MCSSDLGFIANTAKWNELPKLYKEALTAACAEANNWTPAKYDAVNPAALKRLVAGGATLRPFTPEVMDHCYKAAQELYKELAEKNAAFKKIYDSYTAWMADGYLWHQVADFTMDSYMIRYRNQRT